MMRVIGIDPGLVRTGWGVVEARGEKLVHLGDGYCRSGSGDLAVRLARLYGELQTVFDRFEPAAAAVEHTFVNKDATGTLKLGQARAVALLVPARAGLPVAEYAPNAVKKAVVGVGHADKTQVEHMIKLLLPGVKPASADSADALAIAICHIWNHRASSRREKAVSALS